MIKLPAMSTVQKGKCSTDDAQKQWLQLNDALTQIYRQNTASYSFQHLYQLGYQLVQHNQGDFLYEKLTESIKARICDQALILSESSQPFLHGLLKQWESHVMTITRTAKLFNALDRHVYAKKQPQLIRLGHNLFGELIVKQKPFCDKLKTSFLSVVEKDRLGEEMPAVMLLKAISAMAAEVDKAACFDALIEQPFLERTRTFYQSESTDLIVHATTPQFIKVFFDRLHGEKNRTTSCIDEITCAKVETILAEEFLKTHKTTLLTKEGSGCQDLLKTWRVDEIRELFRAFLIIHETPFLVGHICRYFREEGFALTSNAEYTAKADVFVEKIIGLREQMNTLLREALVIGENQSRDRYAEVELSRVFSEVVNKYPNTAEYLSQFLDGRLKAQLEDREIEQCSEQVLTVFAHLHDKDIFENAYKLHLARRLLQGKNVNEEQERIFIGLLKKECGTSAASKLEGMFNDRRSSADVMESFRKRLEQRGEKLPHDINVQVLTSGFWPQVNNLSLTLPQETERCSAIFRMFYLARHKGRRLEFLMNQGSADLRLVHNGKRNDVNVPTQCMPVLLLFQGSDPMTVAEVAEASGLGVPEAAKVVVTLARTAPAHTPLLKVEAVEGQTSNAVTAHSTVRFNEGFKSKTVKIKIANVVTMKDKGSSSSGSSGAHQPVDAAAASAAARSSGITSEQLEEDRKYKIDAAIVRIMKSRRTLEHKVLVSEVVTVLRNSFVPSADSIKRRIEHLIEREFLERNPDQRGVYNYLAH